MTKSAAAPKPRAKRLGLLLLALLGVAGIALLGIKRSAPDTALTHAALVPAASAPASPASATSAPVASVGSGAAAAVVDEPADYAKVFDTSKVHRLEIEISPADWKTLQDSLPRPQNLEQVFGAEFPALHQPCKGLRHYDVCKIPGKPAGTIGRCRGADSALACLDGRMVQRTRMVLASPKTYIPCTVRYEGKTWTNVGFRFKGGSTFRSPFLLGTSQKYPFRLQMSRFADPATGAQRFFGFDKLTFANGALDETLMRDYLASELYRAFAVPAPKVAFYRVFLNYGTGTFYYGLFSMIEDPDGPMLAASYKSGDGNLYEPTAAGASWRETFASAGFRKETNSAQGNWQDVERAFAALNANLPDAAWRAGFEKTFDVELFLHWLVVTAFTSPTDTHGFGAPHNYYLYGDPGDGGRLKWLPWDNDSAFKGSAKPFLDDVKDFPLIRKVLDSPVYFARYKKLLRQLLAGPAKPEFLLATIQKQRQLIAPYMLGPEGEQAGYTSLRGEASVDYEFKQLETFITNRHQTLLDALKQR